MSQFPDWYSYFEIEPSSLCKLVNAHSISYEKECRFLQGIIIISRDSLEVRSSLIDFVEKSPSAVLFFERLFLN